MKINLIKKMSMAFLAGAVIGGTCFAADNAKVKAAVNPGYYDELLRDGYVSRYRDNGSMELLLIPESFYSAKVKNSMVKKEDKNYPYTFEGLYLLNKKDLLAKGSSGKSEITIDDVSKVVRSVSKMQGMKYYSTTHKKELVLYEKCYMIAGPGDKTKVADQNTGNADGQVSYCFQNDSSFGECRYKLNYYQSENEMMAVFSNIDTLGLGPFKAIYPGCMTINILVRDLGEKVLVYICCDLDSIKFPGIKGQITDSISSRMVAVYNWFVKQF